MRRLAVTLCACASFSFLTACAAGPNYHAPLAQEPAPERFAAATPAVAAAGEPVDDWWRLYQDPVLDGLIAKALYANTDLRVASANLSRARAVLGGARVGLYSPTTTVTASVVEGRSATANAFAALKGTKAKASPTDSAAFAASYELDLFGRLRRGVEAARADSDVAKAALDLARVAVAADTTRAYVDVCALGAAVDAADTARKLARQTADITEDRRRLGAASDFDVARARALAAQADAATPALRAQRAAALFSLAVLTGQAPETAQPAVEACRKPLRLATVAPVGDGAGLLRRRPDVRAAERQLAADTARIGVATASLFPTLTLGGQLGIGGATPDKAATYSGTTFSVGPALSWTAPNILAARALVAQSNAQARASLARLDGVVLTALKDVETALATLDSERQRQASLSAARDELDTAARLAKARYDQGAASFLDLIDAERSLRAGEADLAAEDQRLGEAEVALFRALGGGWKQAPVPLKRPL